MGSNTFGQPNSFRHYSPMFFSCFNSLMEPCFTARARLLWSCRQFLTITVSGCSMDPKTLRAEGEILSHLVAKRKGALLLFTC